MAARAVRLDGPIRRREFRSRTSPTESIASLSGRAGAVPNYRRWRPSAPPADRLGSDLGGSDLEGILEHDNRLASGTDADHRELYAAQLGDAGQIAARIGR